jgi:DNA repair protein RadC
MPGIKELPEAERPREKLRAQGSGSLSNTELLAILIGNGSGEDSAMDLASKILTLNENGIFYLSTASTEELACIAGIGEAKACRIAAAAELGRRISRGSGSAKTRFGAPEEIAALFMEDMRRETRELFQILLLNVRGEMMGKELVSVGNIQGAIVDPRDVFKPAIRRGAASIILVHNHPSGNPEPSGADIEATRRIVDAGKLLDVKVLDHLIIGDGIFTSLKRIKLM